MVAAVIVLYHPELSLLERLLESVLAQVNTTILVDNTPTPSAQFKCFLEKYGNKFAYIALGQNRGIATAQNIGIRRSLSEECSHVLLLDQDSAPDAGMVAALLASERQLLAEGKPVASIGPLFVDEKTRKPSFAIKPGRIKVKRLSLDVDSTNPIETHYLIASGSLTRSIVLEKIGLLQDDLFIDWVDIEWGLRARSEGYISYIAPNAIMTHSIGDATVRFLGKDINIHSDTRNYYMVRNATYLLRYNSFREWRLINLIKITLYVVFYSLYSKHPWRSSKLLVGAVVDGIRGTLGQIAREA
jgi:rhamnosyltransferase